MGCNVGYCRNLYLWSPYLNLSLITIIWFHVMPEHGAFMFVANFKTITKIILSYRNAFPISYDFNLILMIMTIIISSFMHQWDAFILSSVVSISFRNNAKVVCRSICYNAFNNDNKRTPYWRYALWF